MLLENTPTENGTLLNFMCEKIEGSSRILYSKLQNGKQKLYIKDYRTNFSQQIFETSHNINYFNFSKDKNVIFVSISNSEEYCNHYLLNIHDDIILCEELLIDLDITNGKLGENNYFYVSTDGSGESRVFKYTLDNNETNLIFSSNEGICSILGVSPSGDSVIFTQLISPENINAYFYRNNSVCCLTLHLKKYSINSIKSISFITESQFYILAHNNFGGLSLIYYEFPGKLRVLSGNLHREIIGIVYNKYNKKLYSLERSGVIDKISCLDLETLNFLHISNELLSIEDIQIIDSNLVLSISTPNENKNLFLFNSDLNFVNRLTSFRSLLYENLITPEIVNFRSTDSLNIEALLYKAEVKNNSNAPVIIWCHGGPHDANRYEYSPLAQLLVSEGFHVIMPNFRGSTCYGRDFETSIYGNWSKPSEDILATINFVTDIGLTKNNIILMGASYGGYLSLLCAGKYHSLIKGSISIGGPTDINSFIRHVPQKWEGTVQTWLGKDYKINESPFDFLEHFSCPILMIYSKDDPRVSYNGAIDFYNNLQKRGIKVDFTSIENGGHSMNNSMDIIANSCSSFLEKLMKEEVEI